MSLILSIPTALFYGTLSVGTMRVNKMYFLPLFLYLPHTSHYRTCLPMYPAWSYTTLALTLRPQSLLTTTSQKTGLIVGRILVLVWQGLEGMVILHMGVQMNIFLYFSAAGEC